MCVGHHIFAQLNPSYEPLCCVAGSNCVVPINDIRGVESMGYAKGEKILRCKLAAVYRLIDLYGWTQNIHNHITVRFHLSSLNKILRPLFFFKRISMSF